ncbi:hypothetical protein Z968_10390 [Clostridium novyi A str. 4552]|uniref:Type I restriction modification DNA specificity domain-containing protein n=1 Tax=Clostridium novyi A str. 4552 TaxID=1444289 RepID=A0A0A0I2B8_CLONO|nr:restriction endonuclease subunit S [Clostridium novyi]KGM94947.1 hypothetical protein Z968_10390 [Clostridium novyi A str. 4552]
MSFKLEDMADFQKGFAFKSRDFKKSGIKIVKVSNLTDESIDGSGCVHIDNELADNYNQYELNSDDIIITTVGSWPTNPASVVGKVVRVPKHMNGSLLNQNAVRVRSNQNVDQKYLFYLLKSNIFKDYIIGTAQGSANQASITQKDIKNFKYDIHEFEEQKVIASILSALDEKIETNNQINKKLEEMAQAIFKHWFVDFEFPNEEGKPYKSSGGEMVESEMGMIPKGWEVKQLKNHIKFIKGKKPKIINDFIFENSEVYLTIDVLNRNSVQYAINDKVVLATKRDVLMVMDGASSGKLYYGMNGIVGSTLAKIEVDSRLINSDILYFFLKNNEYNIKMHLTGSAIPHTDKEYINKLYIAIPRDKNMLANVVETLSDIRMKIIVNDEENNILKCIRDTLLPKLMSGEIRVPLK